MPGHDFLGTLLTKWGPDREALESHRRALDIRERLARDHPSVVAFQLDLARSRDYVAIQLFRAGEHAKGLEAHREVLRTRETLSAPAPGSRIPATSSPGATTTSASSSPSSVGPRRPWSTPTGPGGPSGTRP